MWEEFDSVSPKTAKEKKLVQIGGKSERFRWGDFESSRYNSGWIFRENCRKTSRVIKSNDNILNK